MTDTSTPRTDEPVQLEIVAKPARGAGHVAHRAENPLGQRRAKHDEVAGGQQRNRPEENPSPRPEGESEAQRANDETAFDKNISANADQDERSNIRGQRPWPDSFTSGHLCILLAGRRGRDVH